MTIKITGKNLDLGDSLRTYATDRLTSVVGKYAGQSLSGQISIEKNTPGFVTRCSVHLTSGIDMQSEGQSIDPYGSVDVALERLEKRLRRYRRRLKDHGQSEAVASQQSAVSGVDYTLEYEEDEPAAENANGGPAIIAEMEARVRTMSVSDAVMQMDLADQSFLVFRNAAHGGVNVVYRRPDGNIGWIDPSVSIEKR